MTDRPRIAPELLAALEAVVADLGGALDGAYWVRDVVPAGDGDVTGEVALTSHGIAEREPTVTERLSVDVPGPTPHLLTGQDRGWRTLPTDNALSGSLTGVDEVTVDLARSGLTLDGLEVDVSADGPTTLHLVDGDHRERVELS
jgi:hypothetical protein